MAVSRGGAGGPRVAGEVDSDRDLVQFSWEGPGSLEGGLLLTTSGTCCYGWSRNQWGKVESGQVHQVGSGRQRDVRLSLARVEIFPATLSTADQKI